MQKGKAPASALFRHRHHRNSSTDELPSGRDPWAQEEGFKGPAAAISADTTCFRGPPAAMPAALRVGPVLLTSPAQEPASQWGAAPPSTGREVAGLRQAVTEMLQSESSSGPPHRLLTAVTFQACHKSLPPAPWETNPTLKGRESHMLQIRLVWCRGGVVRFNPSLHPGHRRRLL